MSDDEVFELDPLEKINITDSPLPTTKPTYLYSFKVKSYSKRQSLTQFNAITPIQLRKIPTFLSRIYFDQKLYNTVPNTSHRHCHKDCVAKHSLYLQVHLPTYLPTVPKSNNISSQ